MRQAVLQHVAWVCVALLAAVLLGVSWLPPEALFGPPTGAFSTEASTRFAQRARLLSLAFAIWSVVLFLARHRLGAFLLAARCELPGLWCDARRAVRQALIPSGWLDRVALFVVAAV